MAPRLRDLDEPCVITDADTSWVLLSSLLVLSMCPALALFEAGMLRSKNVLSIVTQIFSGVTVLSVMWVVIGYTLVFGPDKGGIIGGLDYVGFRDVSYSDCGPHASAIPHACFAIFQMMFAAITPLLITGAYAERMRFKAFFIFTVLWEILIYYPLAHWIWGGGFFHTMGVLDFAGGIVIHTSAGTSALVCAIMLGKRYHFEKYTGEFPPHNLPLAALGTALLWSGWFGFNGGSALKAGKVAVSAIVSTQVGGSVSALVWLILTSWYHTRPSASGVLNGTLAGLAGITPASGYIETAPSIILGVVFGFSSFYGVVLAKHHLGIDDALDVSMVHGLTGVIGALAIGIFAQQEINEDGADGWWYGRPILLWYQFLAVITTIVYTGIWTYIILKIIDKYFGGIRVTLEEEIMGTDWSEHREIAYHKLHVLDEPDDEEDQDTFNVLNNDSTGLRGNGAGVRNNNNLSAQRSKGSVTDREVSSSHDVRSQTATGGLVMVSETGDTKDTEEEVDENPIEIGEDPISPRTALLGRTPRLPTSAAYKLSSKHVGSINSSDDK